MASKMKARKCDKNIYRILLDDRILDEITEIAIVPTKVFNHGIMN